MDHEEVGRHWDANAEAWTRLARAGYDVYRDELNTPAFLEMLPDVDGLSGLDVGCGEGHNTRLVSARGARMTDIDISENFVRHAKEEESREPRGIRYRRASAMELPFENAGFDFAVAFMSLMDMPELERVLAEIFRVVRRFPAVLDRAPVLHHPAPQDPPPRARAGVRARGGRLLPGGGRRGAGVGL